MGILMGLRTNRELMGLRIYMGFSWDFNGTNTKKMVEIFIGFFAGFSMDFLKNHGTCEIIGLFTGDS